MSFARERAAKAADNPGLALDLRRARNRLAQRFARECLPRWYPTFPSAYYLTAKTGGVALFLRADERLAVADHLDALNEVDATRAAVWCEDAPNYAYREVSHEAWHGARPWERVPTFQWATNALARGEDPTRVRTILSVACALERDFDAAVSPTGLGAYLSAAGLAPEARHALFFYNRGLYNPHYEDYLREHPDPRDAARR